MLKFHSITQSLDVLDVFPPDAFPEVLSSLLFSCVISSIIPESKFKKV